MTGLLASRVSRLIRLCSIGALAAGALTLGGCNKSQLKDQEMTIAELQTERDQLQSENERLSGEMQTLRERASGLESEKASLETQLASAASAQPQQASSGASPSDRVLSVAGDVAFGPGQTTLTAAGKREIDKIISIIRSQYSGSRIEVAGFTDSDPLRKTKSKYTDNENLSAQRALSVERYLNSNGIPADLTHSSGYGPAFSKGSKKDSRRVEIRILAN